MVDTGELRARSCAKEGLGHISEICIDGGYIFFLSYRDLIDANIPTTFLYLSLHGQHNSRWRLFGKANEFVSKSLAFRCYSKISLPSAVASSL